MIAGLRPYAEMKDSDVAWLGRVPAHWEVLRGKWLFRNCKVLNSNRAETNVLSLTLRGVVNNDPDDPEGLVPKDYGTYQLFRKDDLVFKLIDLENFRTSRVGLVHEDGIMSSAYVRLSQAHRGLQRYFYLQYYDLYQRGIYNQLGAGVRSTLGASDLLDLPIAVPSLDEQSAIVRFLDHADRRIRRAIAAKQKLIRLLEEQKRAIIHRAVTRGLDPDVRLKPSGIEWLGDVPESWRIGRVKSELRNLNTKRVPLSSPERGKMTRRTYDYYGASGVIDKVDDYLFDDDLILIAEDGANLVLRNLPLAIIARGRFWVNNHAHILKPVSGSLEYFAALLECINYLPWITGAAQPKLTQDRLMSISIPVPPEGEQGEIAAWIETNTKSLRASAEKVKREIELLREYRIRLVADVVTGKLDVREAAASLPEMTEPRDSEFDAVEEYEDDSTEDITAEDQAE